MNTVDVLGLSLEQLRLPEKTTFYLVKKVHPQALYRDRERLAREETVKAVLDAWKPSRRRYSARERSVHVHRFKKKLVALGLSRLDWIHLPQKTVTLKKQRMLPKEAWLDLPASLLGTISPHAMMYITKNDDECMSVRELLSMPEKADWLFSRYFMGRCRKSVHKTRERLQLLGFTYEDGPFMRHGTKRERLEQLMSRHNLGKRTASMVFDIAKAEGWISKRAV